MVVTIEDLDGTGPEQKIRLLTFSLTGSLPVGSGMGLSSMWHFWEWEWGCYCRGLEGYHWTGCSGLRRDDVALYGSLFDPFRLF